MKRIFIIGAGAVGKVLAVALKKEGREVVVLRGSVADGPTSQETIKVLLHDGSVLQETVEISTLSQFSRLDGLVLLTNKSYGNERLAHLLKDKIGDSPIALLQNGLGIERPFQEKHFPKIYRAVLFMTSQVNDTGVISYKPVAVSPIGTIASEDDQLEVVVSLLHSPHFQFRAEPHIQEIIWEKAIANSVFNSICPLLHIDNGVFHREPQVMDLAKRVIVECIAVAKEHGIVLQQQQLEARILQISEKSDGQFISTLQDIQKGRETEIDTLNLEFARVAKALGKEHLIRETALLGELTLLKSRLSRAAAS
ncbi:2-dehydropantoate 2-reductase [Flavobacteriaceae bacterium 3-367]